MASPIYQIKQLQEDGGWGEAYTFAADANNVIYENNDGVTFSLADFISQFMSEAQFTYTGAQTPSNDNVKVWYQTFE